MTAPHLARYPRGHRAALSLTFDDGFRNEVRDALSVLDPLGIKGTFFLIPMGIEEGLENMVTWQEARALLAAGHEIGTHGFTKFKLHEADDAQLDELVNGSWQTIRDRVGLAPVSYAVAGGTDRTDPRVREKVLERHFFLRGDILVYGNKPDRRWSDTETRARLTRAMHVGEWVTACLHSIIGGYTPFDSVEDFRVHCEWLCTQDLWIAPMGEVGAYARQRDASTIRIVEERKDGVAFAVSSRLPRIPGFHRPLSVGIPAPPGVTAMNAMSARGSVEVLRSGRGFFLEVEPDGGAIQVIWE